MSREIIPWRIFEEVLKNQPRARFHEWLGRWRFTDAGVFALAAPTQQEDALRRSVYNTVFERRRLKRRRALH
jgi:hypothetical protein